MAVSFLSMGGSITAAQYCFGLFVDPIENEFGWSRVSISASLSFVAVGSLFGPFIGRFMDRYGARPVLVGSCLITGISFLLRPLMSELWHWYVLSFIQFSMFAGCTMLPVGRLIGLWFGDQRGRMMGITAAGPNVMGMFMPALIVAVLAASNWQTAYLALGTMMVMIAVLGMVLIREPAETKSANNASAQPALTGWSVSDAMKTRAFYLATLAVILAFFTYGTVLPHVISHLTNQDISPAHAAGALGLLAFFGVLGKVGFGLLSEKISARKAYMVDLTGQAICTYLLATTDGNVLLWIAVPGYGLFLGGVGSLAPLLIQETFGLRHFGSIMGISNMATVLSFAIGPLLAGWSFDVTGSYNTAYLIVAALFIAGVAVLAVLRVPAHTATASKTNP